MSTPPVGTVTTTTVGLTSTDLASMDIETALMAVQTQRANLLENQLKEQMEAVRKRNVQIEALNNLLAEVRDIRPPGKPEDKVNTSTGDNVNVPGTVREAVGADGERLSQLQDEVIELQTWLNDKGPTTSTGSDGTTGTSGTSGTTGNNGGTSSSTVTVPSSDKLTVPVGNDPRAPYAKALNDLVDANAQDSAHPDYGTLVGSNRQMLDGFVAYNEQYKSLYKAPIPKDLQLGFNSNSDDGDIQQAFENPNVRAAFETYLRLGYQGNGAPKTPNTPIISLRSSGAQSATAAASTAAAPTAATAPATAPADGEHDWHSIGGLTPDSSAADIQAALDSRMAEIAQLQDNANLVETSDTFTTMSLDQALAHYGFTSGDLSQQQFDQLINNISSRIDSLNSSQQLDMLRLQSLTNKRNESFDIMTNFIKKLQDNRSSIIGNMR